MSRRNVHAASLSDRRFSQRIVRVRRREILEIELDLEMLDDEEESGNGDCREESQI